MTTSTLAAATRVAKKSPVATSRQSKQSRVVSSPSTESATGDANADLFVDAEATAQTTKPVVASVDELARADTVSDDKDAVKGGESGASAVAAASHAVKKRRRLIVIGTELGIKGARTPVTEQWIASWLESGNSVRPSVRATSVLAVAPDELPSEQAALDDPQLYRARVCARLDDQIMYGQHEFHGLRSHMLQATQLLVPTEEYFGQRAAVWRAAGSTRCDSMLVGVGVGLCQMHHHQHWLRSNEDVDDITKISSHAARGYKPIMRGHSVSRYLLAKLTSGNAHNAAAPVAAKRARGRPRTLTQVTHRALDNAQPVPVAPARAKRAASQQPTISVERARNDVSIPTVPSDVRKLLSGICSIW
jgi:hypothetical protein